MFRSPTVFVIGAGASAEVDLPVGTSLVHQIKTGLRFTLSTFGEPGTGGDQNLRRTILNYVGQAQASSALALCREISHSLDHADSIDAFVNEFKHNSDVAKYTKLAIAHYISIAEAGSKLIVNRNNANNGLRLDAVESTWFERFFRILRDGVDVEQVSSIFDNLSIVCFNYDRCIEQYLFYSLRHYYRIDQQSAIEVLRTLKVLRPYGHIGGFSYNPESGHSNFGMPFSDAGLIEQSKTLRTVYEGVADKFALQPIHNAIASAEQIVFLGFGFHKLNMELLAPGKPCSARRILATAKDVPGPSLRIFRRYIENYLLNNSPVHEPPRPAPDVELLAGKRCADLMNDYSLLLSEG